MNSRTKKILGTRLMHLVPVCIGIAVNVILTYIMYRFGMPYFMDTIGTICISALLGPFYGILAAVVTGFVFAAVNPSAFYYCFVYAIIAIMAAGIIKKHSFKDIRIFARLALMSAAVAGLLCPAISWMIAAEDQSVVISESAKALQINVGVPYRLAFFGISLVLNIVDRAIECAIAFLILRLIPDRVKDWLRYSRWLQNPQQKSIQDEAYDTSSGVRYSVRIRTTVMVVLTSLVIVISVCWVSIRLYYSSEKKDRINEAQGAAALAADILDPDMVDTYVREGENAPGYVEAAEHFKNVWEHFPNVAYLYAVTLKDGICRCALDIEGGEGAPEPYTPGSIIELDEGMDEYLEAVRAGKDAEPFETNDEWGRLISVSCPLRNLRGEVKGYVIADVSINDLMDYIRDFIVKTILIVAGIIFLVMFFELWITEVYTTYPITDLVYCIEKFAASGDEQDALDENVRRIGELDIRTDDEIEKLYNAICNMTLNQAEQMRNIRRLSESTATMQDGLIITMADLVESRDSDTGEHVQKTAAYVRVIVEGLKKKGYYPEKITPKFMSDVVRSAPLHDVGKINVPDDVLNQPRKLTDEEFEIIKTHTTSGKAIIEKAMTTVRGGNYLKEARNMAAYHHERWDGKGYPEGLHGEVIPLSARIMAVADVFDALTSPRVYKPAYPIEKALEIISEGSGTQFDSKCVEAFMDSLPEVRVILNKYSGKTV